MPGCGVGHGSSSEALLRTPIDARAVGASLQRFREHRDDDSLLLESSLQQVVDTCMQLFDVTDCGIMLIDERAELRAVVVNGTGARRLEEAQAVTGQGPGVDAVLDDRTVTSAKVTDDGRWPALVERLSGAGPTAVLAVPLRLSGVPVGSLNVACDTVHDWSAAEREALSGYAEVAESMLVAAIGAEEAGALADQLSYAIGYRAPIERGVGYLMARDGIDQPTAFARLRQAARASRRKIVDVAEDLQGTGLLPGETR